MNERDIERAAINEILKETKIAEERNRPPEYGYRLNKRLLSRNLVSTLRNPVFPRNLKKRRIIGLDDETEDESETDHKRRKYSRGQNHFADDDYIYDARDYFNPEKYREIVAYRNRKHQRREYYERKKSTGYVGDSFYAHDVTEDNCEDMLERRELQDCENEELEADVVDERSRIELLAITGSTSYVLENTNNNGTCNHRKRKHHKSKDTSTHSHQKKHSKHSKHRHKVKLGCVQEDEDKIYRKHKEHKTRIKKNSQRKKKRELKKQKKVSCNSDVELDRLNEHAVEDFSEIRSGCVRNISPYDSRAGNEGSGSSVQGSIRYNGSTGNYRQSEDGYCNDIEQVENRPGAPYESSALVSVEYLNELYFRTRHKSDNVDRSISSLISASYDKNSCSDYV